MLRPAVIGKDGRTTAIKQCLGGSVIELSTWKASSSAEAMRQLLERALVERPDFVVVGPEDPLAAGVVDQLATLGIAAVGPTRACARLEASKSFTRELLRTHNIPGNPRYRIFGASSSAGPSDSDARQWLEELGSQSGFVVKPDGLTGGKGVRVSGDHLKSVDEAVEYARDILRSAGPVVIEERLDGEEFSLQSFSDGKTLVHMPAVQDHKRAWEGDQGPNTGGMGSYSCADHSLPFLSAEHIAAARAINERVAQAIRLETGTPYRGVLYGGFMATREGVRLIEYNVRLGDPEALNVLPLLETSFTELCQAIINGTLDQTPVRFKPLSTVCKYLVPEGYPGSPVKGAFIDLSEVVKRQSERLRIFHAAVEEHDGKLLMTGSRAVAVVGLAPTLEEAFSITEEAASLARGSVVFRHDIGSRALVQRRIDHMQAVRTALTAH